MAEIREYSDHGNVEISRETWNVLRSSFACVTVAFKRGTFPVAYDDVAVIDRGISLERLALE